jgi:hypothetical protein
MIFMTTTITTITTATTITTITTTTATTTTCWVEPLKLNAAGVSRSKGVGVETHRPGAVWGHSVGSTYARHF